MADIDKRWLGTCRLQIAAALFLIVGCESGGGASVEPSQQRLPQPLVVASVGDPATFNPIIAADPTARAIGGAVFDTLLALDTTEAGVRPNLAQRWTYDEDLRGLELELRDDVVWQDGKPFTAADVVFTANAILASPDSPYARVLRIDRRRISVSQTGEHSVRFSLPRAHAAFVPSLVIPILPSHRFAAVVAGQGINTVARQWTVQTPVAEIIGTGPFRLAEYRAGESAQLVRSERYWKRDGAGVQLPYLDRYVIRIADSRKRMLDWFLGGATHIYSPRFDEVATIENHMPVDERKVEVAGLDTSSLFLTFNRNPARYRTNGKIDPRLRWFADRRFLQAVAHAIDKQAIVDEVLAGHGAPALSHLPPSSPFSNSELTDYEYDPALSRRILEDAGYRDRNGDGQREDSLGNAIHFTLSTNEGNPIRQRIAKMVIAQLARIGMRITLETLAFPALFERLDATYAWDAMLIGFTGGIDPSSSDNLLASSSDLHVWNPMQRQPASAWERDIDRLLDEGRRQTDPAKRREIYWHVQEILHDELPMIHLVRPKLFAARHRSVENFVPSPWGFTGVEKVRLQPAADPTERGASSG